MLLPEIGNYLVAQGVAVAGSTAKWSLGLGYEPATPDGVITIVETGGFPQQELSTQPLERPTFQVRVRGPINLAGSSAYMQARKKLNDVMTTLETVMNKTIGNPAWRYVHIRRQGEPLSLGFDNTNRPSVAVNFSAIRSRTS